MSKNKICIACGFEDFEENINNFCCNCGKDIDTGLTLEEMDKQGINYLIDRRTNEYRNSILPIKIGTSIINKNEFGFYICNYKTEQQTENALIKLREE